MRFHSFFSPFWLNKPKNNFEALSHHMFLLHSRTAKLSTRKKSTAQLLPSTLTATPLPTSSDPAAAAATPPWTPSPRLSASFRTVSNSWSTASPNHPSPPGWGSCSKAGEACRCQRTWALILLTIGCWGWSGWSPSAWCSWGSSWTGSCRSGTSPGWTTWTPASSTTPTPVSTTSPSRTVWRSSKGRCWSSRCGLCL